MRGTVAKRIRRAVYGQFSSRPEVRAYRTKGERKRAWEQRREFQGLKRARRAPTQLSPAHPGNRRRRYRARREVLRKRAIEMGLAP